MANFPVHKTFLAHNKVLLTKFLPVTDRLAAQVIKDVQVDRAGNWFVIFHDSFAKYFGNRVIILNGFPPGNLIALFQRIVGDLIDGGAYKSMNLWVITSLVSQNARSDIDCKCHVV
jgi:hypothetical protein